MQKLLPLLLVGSMVAGLQAERGPWQLIGRQGHGLIQSSDLTYLGAFALPAHDFDFANAAIAYNPANNSLFVGSRHCPMGICDDTPEVAEVTIPALVVATTGVGDLNRATYLQTLHDVSDGHFGDIGSGSKILTGLWVTPTTLYATTSLYYTTGDGTGSHWVSGLNLSLGSDVTGPFLTTQPVGFTNGYFGYVPSLWQTLYGLPVLNGNCCMPVISGTSYGPSVSVLDPSVLSSTPAPATMLLGYPQVHPLQPYGNPGINLLWNSGSAMGGVVMPEGTRSVLFFGRIGIGSYCYGQGTSDPSLNGTLVGPSEPDVIYCYDPEDSSKGEHSGPYKPYVWYYDANDLLAVKNGVINAWDPRPYAVTKLDDRAPAMGILYAGKPGVAGVAYDATNGIVYCALQFEDAAAPVIHAFSFAR